MEDPIPFDLNRAICSWKDCLRCSPHFREEDLMELETHVLDSIAAFRAKGLADEEAFLLATRRLGKPSGLEPEFAKVNRPAVWLNRLLWMLVGILGWGLLRGLSNIAAKALIFGGLWGLGIHVQPVQADFAWSRAVLPVTFMTLTYLLVLVGILVGCWRIIRRKESEAGHFLARALRRPVAMGVVAALALLAVQALSGIESALIARHFSMPEIGAISLYQQVSGLLLMLAQTLAFVVLTITLLCRRFRPTAPALLNPSP